MKLRTLLLSLGGLSAAGASLSAQAAAGMAWETPQLGAPYFFGRWAMSIQASPREEVIDGDVYIVAEPGAALEDLIIHAEGTYRWTIHGTVYEGSWRPAAESELHIDKLPGLVLVKARDDQDWIVTEAAGACSAKNGDADKAWCEQWVGGISAVDEINLRPVGWGAPSFDGKRAAPDGE